ncbi:DUF7091 family protein [Natronobacterium gregoryi]|uniref:Uncharacterized protein n=2 Tax=Natronobacterium gregoryi TaxID=44930 RepID=L0AIX9_NATGS|nr:hypothetical protein [Natronobacterium gregoryi]AFZ73020.1 hypothetical protein Natgr_1829 [Natronobacterium gregoryi SP2]ELY64875.1 hypothetical protein C490_14355 [Natronobacterium gregoryi SP2]PLK18380.1 hypothetical protein CYV19_18075 [Natronobacterium gregoryi SP2]SFJ71645.1 hypothetical protein SAMN05443661_16413 [Natronobacterium gregoryi]
MPDRRRVERFFRSKLQEAGKQYEQLRKSTDGQLEETREVYEVAKNARCLPLDEAGRAQIVCRRYAERRAAKLDDQFRPACYEDGQPDCDGCVEDIHSGRVETWEMDE